MSSRNPRIIRLVSTGIDGTATSFSRRIGRAQDESGPTGEPSAIDGSGGVCSAVVLLSGGLDSSTVLAMALADGFRCFTLSLAYGQRHDAELRAARAVAGAAGAARHVELDIDLRVIGGSALTADLAVPKRESPDAIAAGIPVTYVPARNTIFLAFALAFAETVSADDIFMGVSAVDYSGYPDCRPEYVAAFETLANLATRRAVEGCPVRLHAPLMQMTKAQTIARGIELGVDYGLTHSCYDPGEGGLACGECDACLLRRRGFAENGLDDPIAYA